MRKKHNPAVKFKVAFEALSGKSVVAICKKPQFGVSDNKLLVESNLMVEIFSGSMT